MSTSYGTGDPRDPRDPGSPAGLGGTEDEASYEDRDAATVRGEVGEVGGYTDTDEAPGPDLGDRPDTGTYVDTDVADPTRPEPAEGDYTDRDPDGPAGLR